MLDWDKALRSLWLGLATTSVFVVGIAAFLMAIALIAFLFGSGTTGWIGIFFIVVGVVAIFAYNDKLT